MNFFQMHIKKGHAVVVHNGIRCQGPRLKQPDQLCNRLLAKKNDQGIVAGWFRCERCGQDIVVEVIANRLSKTSE